MFRMSRLCTASSWKGQSSEERPRVSRLTRRHWTSHGMALGEHI